MGSEGFIYFLLGTRKTCHWRAFFRDISNRFSDHIDICHYSDSCETPCGETRNMFVISVLPFHLNPLNLSFGLQETFLMNMILNCFLRENISKYLYNKEM